MIYVIDASVYVFRAWFSIPDSMIDPEENPVNAMYGFARFLSDFLEYTKPKYVAVTFDESLKSCFRNDIYPPYKANRDPAPPELKQQFARCRQVTRALGLPDFAAETYEADDLIGTIVTSMRADGLPATIISRDKDLLQLLQEPDVMWDYAGNKRTGYHDVANKHGVHPEQMVDYLALAGDSVDNIPGVKGVGPKTAAALLDHFETFDNIYERLDEVESLNIRGAKTLGAKLANHKDDALVSRKLTKIHCEVPIATTRESFIRTAPDMDALTDVYDTANFGAMLRRQAERITDQF
ncbi:MAG: 5'-3' exonuclease [Gammaproteobacteria bacterium]